MAIATTELTIHVRVAVNGADVPLWRVKLLGLVAWLLGVPITATGDV